MLMLLPLLAFLFASLLIAAGAMALAPASAATIERRLGEVSGTRRKEKTEGEGYNRTVIDALKKIGSVAPRPAKEMGKLQQRLVNAGYRSHEALPIFFGIRLAFAVVVFLVMSSPIVRHPNMALSLAGCGLGGLKLESRGRIVRVPQGDDAAEIGNGLLQQLQPFRRQVG